MIKAIDRYNLFKELDFEIEFQAFKMRVFKPALFTFLFPMLFFLAGCQTVNSAIESTPSAHTTELQTAELAGQQAFSPGTIRFTHIGLEDGLSQSTIYSIAQDSQGYIWFGTEDGLNRYDGYEFKIFRPDLDDPASLSDRWITTLLADDSGNLWVGTRQSGLNYYNSKTGKFTRFLHDEEDSQSLVYNHIQVLYKDRHGRLWIGTSSGLDSYSSTTGNFTHYSLETTNQENSKQKSISAIYEDEDENLWIGTGSAGLFKLSPASGKFTQFLNDRTDVYSISGNSVRGILPTGAGSLWLATNAGLNLFDPEKGIFTRFRHSDSDLNTISDDYVRDISLDHSGILWVGTDAGLDRYDVKSGIFSHYRHDATDAKSLSNNIVLSIFESNDQVLWVGTFGGSINKYYRGMDRFSYFHHNANDPTSLSGNILFKIFVDADQLVWLATVDGGLNRLDPVTGKIIAYTQNSKDTTSLASNEVWSVFKDSQGVLWVGTTLGLDRLNPGTSRFIHYSSMDDSGTNSVNGIVYDMVEDKDGILWMGTEGGLAKYDRNSDSFFTYTNDINDPTSITGSSVVKVYLDAAGNLWAGTFAGGLNRLDAKAGSFIRYYNDPSDPNSISNNSIMVVFQDHTGRLWVGTGGGGLNLLDPVTNTFTHFTEDDGLPNNVVYGILEDSSGKLWLSTNNGISCFDPFALTFTNYTESDGLQGNEFNMNAYAMDKNGLMYFGGVNGLTVFNPNQVNESTFVPPVVLLSITQNGLPLSSTVTAEQLKEVDIKWPYNSFEFEFAALSYADPEKNQYSYRLQNFDDDWLKADYWREGRYTNLPGGSYTLNIKGSNADGVWNEEGHSIKINVVPAFWQTLWFKISAILLICGLVFGFYQIRTRNIQDNNRELERQVKERTKEIERLFEKTKELAVVEERNRLARELHDSAKQKAFAALAQLGTASGVLPQNPQAARVHLQEAENLVYEVIEELTFLIQEMYPLALKEKGLATSLREYVFDWEARTGIQVLLQIDNERRVHLEVEQANYRAIQEALSNVARHSQATSVKINLTYESKEILAVVSDNGRGFDPVTRPSGMGLRTIRERIEALGGSVVIESTPGSGTCLTLQTSLNSHRLQKGEKNV